MAEISLQGTEKRFGGQVILDKIDLSIKEGEFLVLVGPSGCGKSTLLRLICGLEDPTSGDIVIDGSSAIGIHPKDRNLAMVFQSYALYPHMTVFDNMALGLKIRKVPKDQIEKEVTQVAEILNIKDFLQRKPGALSGGQRQRVAMGRAIVRRPRAFLFDEPLSNLDAALRLKMRTEIKRLHQELKTTTIYVTHDQTEAMTLADRIVVLNGGFIQQVGSPLEVYQKPANKFVAGFVGAPPMNFLEYSKSSKGDFWDNGDSFDSVAAGELAQGDYYLGVRPEHLIASKNPTQGVCLGKGLLEVVEPLGADVLLDFKLHDQTVVVKMPWSAEYKVGEGYLLSIDPGDLHRFKREGEQERIS